MDFGEALRAMKRGLRARRAGWNGKGMWICRGEGQGALPAASFWNPNTRAHAEGNGGFADVLPYFIMKTADNKVLMGWLASQTDMDAEDWQVLTPDGELLGAHGTHSDGQIVPDDEGDLSLAVGNVKGSVALSFGKSIAWLGMPPAQAREMAAALIEKANEIDGSARG